MKKNKLKLILVVLLFANLSCQVKSEHPEALSSQEAPPTPPPQYLYIASGSCYAGGLTPETPSQTVSKINLENGQILETILDYNSLFPSDSPTVLVNYDDQHLIVVVENTSGRRIDKVLKNSYNNLTTYLTNSTALSGILRSAKATADGSLLISKSSAIEKFSSSKSRVMVGANPFISAPAAPCATSTTLISDMAILNSGNIVFAHAAASQNRIAIISGNGYAVAGDCKSAQPAPTATAFPTAMVYIPTAKQLLVAYAGTVAGVDYVYAYDIDESTNAITGATKAFEDPGIIRGASAMTYDSQTGEIYIANGSKSLLNTIEKFTYNSTTKTLTRIGSTPFSLPTVNHRCISSMIISN